jgi:hypothetical protein
MKGRTGKPSREPKKTISKSVIKAARVRLHGGHFGGDKPSRRPDKRARGGGVSRKDFHPGGEKGKLHREMGISEGKKIPAAKLKAATHSRDPEKRRDAIRAETMKKWHHGKK